MVLTTDAVGAVSETMSYDPHGARREVSWQAAVLPVRPYDTPRGFTGHEQLDAVGIIHMNGRIYDPELGRMLSPDPNVPNPTVTQEFNRYAYVHNNPLSYTDPTGFSLSQNARRGELGGGGEKQMIMVVGVVGMIEEGTIHREEVVRTRKKYKTRWLFLRRPDTVKI